MIMYGRIHTAHGRLGASLPITTGGTVAEILRPVGNQVSQVAHVTTS